MTSAQNDRAAHRRPGRRDVPVPAVLGGRRPAPPADPRHPGHLRARQRGRARPGPGPAQRRDAVHPGPQRAGPGARGHRVRQAQPAARHPGRDLVDRPGRAEHGHRGGAGHRQPAAGAAAARRHLRHPAPGSGAAAAAAPAGGGRDRQRRVPPGLPLLRPHHPARAAAHRAARGHAGAHRPGRGRRGRALAAAGHPGPRLRLAGEFLRRAGLGHPASAAGPRRGRRRAGHAGRRGQAADHRGRRRHLLRGHGRARAPRRDRRHPGARDLRRQGRRPAAGLVADRRHRAGRNPGRQHPGPRGRPGADRGGAADRLRHRLPFAVRRPRGALRRASTSIPATPTGSVPPASSPTPGRGWRRWPTRPPRPACARPRPGGPAPSS